jgi:hypothetical protein
MLHRKTYNVHVPVIWSLLYIIGVFGLLPASDSGQGKESYLVGPPRPRLSYPASTKETEQVYRATWFKETGMQTVQNV